MEIYVPHLLNSIFNIVYAISIIILCSFLGIIVASYAVTNGINLLGIRINSTMRKILLIVSTVLAGYLGLVWIL